MRAYHEYSKYNFFLTPEEVKNISQSPLEAELFNGEGSGHAQYRLNKVIRLIVYDSQQEEGRTRLLDHRDCWEDCMLLGITVKSKYIQEALAKGSIELKTNRVHYFFTIETQAQAEEKAKKQKSLDAEFASHFVRGATA